MAVSPPTVSNEAQQMNQTVANQSCNMDISHPTSFDPKLPPSHEKTTDIQSMPLQQCQNETNTSQNSSNQSYQLANLEKPVCSTQANSGAAPILYSESLQQQIATSHEVMEQNSELPRTIPPLSFSETVKGNIAPISRAQKIMRMKVVPPFRREHFQNPNILERDVEEAIKEIYTIFKPKYRHQVSISRTNVVQHNRNLQILMVTAPAEAEEDIAFAKLRGISIMGNTVFPTGEGFWRFSPQEFPKRAMLRISNLPILLDDEELEELLELPPQTEIGGDILREQKTYDFGKIFTGRAMIPIIISSQKHQDELLNWSLWRNTNGKLSWNEVPLMMSIPKLHKCRQCEQERRPQYIGHDDLWCRIIRRKTSPTPPAETEQVNGQPDANETQHEPAIEKSTTLSEAINKDEETDQNIESNEEDSNEEDSNEETGHTEEMENEEEEDKQQEASTPGKKRKRKKSRKRQIASSCASSSKAPKTRRNKNGNDTS